MDSRLRFLHHLRLFNDAVTQKDRTSRVMVNPVGDARPVGSEVHQPYGVGSAGPKISREASDFTLARKAAKETVGARTGNRHRWARRES